MEVNEGNLPEEVFQIKKEFLAEEMSSHISKTQAEIITYTSDPQLDE